MQNNQPQLIIKHHPFVYKFYFAIAILCLIAGVLHPLMPSPKPQPQNTNQKGTTLYQMMEMNKKNEARVKKQNKQTEIVAKKEENPIGLYFGFLGLFLVVAFIPCCIGFNLYDRQIVLTGNDAQYINSTTKKYIKSFDSIEIQDLGLFSKVIIKSKGLTCITMDWVGNIKAIQKYAEELQNTNSLVK
jgi:hypothetical protein